MIPYLPQPTLALGPFTVHAFGICAAASLLVAYVLVYRRAPLHGLEREWAIRAFVLSVIAGLVTGFLWSRMEARPGISASGVIVGGTGALLLLIGPAASRRAMLGRSIDLYAFALPFALAIARLGCFLAHDHTGKVTHAWLGVRFPGGTRFDLGLLYAIASAAIAVVLVWLSRKSLPAGALSLITIALLAVSRLAILPLGAAPAMDYAIAAAALVVSAVLLPLHLRSAFSSEWTGAGH